MTLLLRFGAHSAGEIPVPIPNTEVKPSSADYTAMRETRKVPNYKKSPLKGVIFLWLCFCYLGVNDIIRVRKLVVKGGDEDG